MIPIHDQRMCFCRYGEKVLPDGWMEVLLSNLMIYLHIIVIQNVILYKACGKHEPCFYKDSCLCLHHSGDAPSPSPTPPPSPSSSPPPFPRIDKYCLVT